MGAADDGVVATPIVQVRGPVPLLVRFDRVYGRVTCYPANAAAEQACALTGKKTFSPSDLKALRALGHEVILSMGSWGVLEQFLGS